MASIDKQTVHAGQTVRILVAGQDVGRIQSIDGQRSFGQEAVYEIGSIMPQEHIALRYDGSVTVDKFHVRKKSLDKLGLGALGEEILKRDVINIVVTDNITGEIVRTYEGCSLQSYSESFRVGSIAGENATWVYLRAR
jgi:hypothetical protein